VINNLRYSVYYTDMDLQQIQVLVHFTAASSVCVHFLLIQHSVPLLSQLQFPIGSVPIRRNANPNPKP